MQVAYKLLIGLLLSTLFGFVAVAPSLPVEQLIETSIESYATKNEYTSSSVAVEVRSSAPIQMHYPRLRIPRLNVDAYIESLGIEADGSMATPKNPWNVAWYKFGALPGSMGSAVIAGHLDSAKGKPAVFWDIKDLQPGDTIEYAYSEHVFTQFIVTKVQSYALDNIPMEKIFTLKDGIYLNLITCDGRYSRSAATYDKRTVVYTELAQ